MIQNLNDEVKCAVTLCMIERFCQPNKPLIPSAEELKYLVLETIKQRNKNKMYSISLLNKEIDKIVKETLERQV